MEKQQGEVADTGCQPPTSPANKSPVFYRMIVPSVLQDKKLRIPESFIKKLGSKLPSVATLTTPNGCTWQVGLKKIEEKVWFADGWHEFLVHQSVRVGYLLVFAYTGNSNFKVSMYDLANAEVEYRCDTLGSSCPVPDEEDDRGSDSVEILDNSPHCHTVKRQKSRPFPQSLGVQCNEKELITSAREIKSDPSNQRPAKPNKRRRGKVSDECESSSAKLGTEVPTPSTRPRAPRKHRVVTSADKDRVLNDSKAFQSDNPFCRIIMRPSYFIKGIGLHIPASFAAQHLNGVEDFITLQSSGTEKWTVQCTWRDNTAKLSKGWYEFVGDNNLEEGDVCFFELIDPEKIVLKVTRFRVYEEDAESAKQHAMDLSAKQHAMDLQDAESAKQHAMDLSAKQHAMDLLFGEIGAN